MTSFSITLVLGFCFALSLVHADSFLSTTKSKEKDAFTECNITNPVPRNPYELITNGIAAGDARFANLSPEEKCNLFCYLQKLKYYDENGNMNTRGIIEFSTKFPGMEKYADVVIAQVFQNDRSTKGTPDKCDKAFYSFLRYTDGFFALSIANALEKSVGIKEKLVSGAPINEALPDQIKKYLQAMDSVFKKA